MRSGRLVFLVLLLCFLTANLQSGLRLPGKYDGVVLFDRWDNCIVFSGVYLMYVSQEAKEALRPYAGQTMEIEALRVYQPINPGDGLIKALRVVGPSTKDNDYFPVRGISLHLEIAREKMTVSVTNNGKQPVKVDLGRLGFAILGEKQPHVDHSLDPSDGRSTAYMTRYSFASAGGFQRINTPNGKLLRGFTISEDNRTPQVFELMAGKTRTLTMHLKLPAGQYQAIVGYGGGVFSESCVPSNAVSFDVNLEGRYQEIQ